MTQLPPDGIPANLRINRPLDYRPEVIKWFKVYAGAMAAMYGLVILFAAFLFLGGALGEDVDQTEMFFIGAIMGGLGFVLFIAYAAALFVPPQPWVWIYDLVLIAIGLTSCLTMIAAIPLLVYWMKPEAKAYFGRT